jgi:DNA-directed RNA polymerase beta' subunit
LKESRGEVLKPETINYRTQSLSVMVFSVKRIFGPVKILNVLVENTKESDTKESFVTVVVLKLLRKKYVETE